jgi:lysophospholipase L1-like esterase
VGIVALACLSTVVGSSPARDDAAVRAAQVPTLAKMAAIGDSLTAATRSCSPSGTTNCKLNSGSAGTSPDVNSHFLRIKAQQPALTADNFSISAHKVAELFRQARLAVNARAQYVTVLAGISDVCRPTVEAMTPVPEFRAYFARAIATFTTRAPSTRIFVASLPDLSRLREVLAANPAARQVWNTTRNCGAFLQNAASEAPADQQRRAAGYQRLLDSIARWPRSANRTRAACSTATPPSAGSSRRGTSRRPTTCTSRSPVRPRWPT